MKRCCFCLDHVLGVKVLACLLMLAEVILLVLSTLFAPQFLFAIAPTLAIGVLCDIFLLVAIFRLWRWLALPWLIYGMIVIVGLCLAAVLTVVIPLGAVQPSQNWAIIAVTSLSCLAIAALLLYFWIVVLEVFIRLGSVADRDAIDPDHVLVYPQPMAAQGAFPVPQYQTGPCCVVYPGQPAPPVHMLR